MSNLFRALGVGAVLSMLAGCGGSQNGSAIALLQTPSSIGATPARVHRAGGSADLLYVMTDVNIFYAVNYSNGKVKTVAYEPSGWGAGDCSDAAGNVYILAASSSSAAGQIFEFSHGGAAPIATLTDGSYYPTGCSVDPMTGNLAVSNDATANCPGGGNIAVYPGAQGSPTIYSDASFECILGTAYDNNGNLFIGGVSNGSGHPFHLAELANGASTPIDIGVDEQISCRPLDATCKNSIQWDGNNVAITVPNGKQSPVVYRVAVSGSNGTVVGTTTFKGKWTSKASGAVSLIDGDKIIMGYHPGSLGVWAYPQGGKLERTIVKGLTHYQFTGLALSPG